MFGLRPWLAWFGLLAVLSGSSPALANGRFPRAQQLLEDPAAPAHLILAATYGLLVTEDRGRHWHYVCEAAYGEPDLTVDALLAVTERGALLAGIYSGVSRAERSPCELERTLGQNNREAVPDFAVVRGHPGQVVAIVTRLLLDGSFEHQLYRSQDDGTTWHAVGELLPAVLSTPLTVDVAPSDDSRVYLSGLDGEGEGVLLRSDDAGQTFQAFAIPVDGSSRELPYIAAVDRDNPDRLYVRTDTWAYDASSGVAHANDALLYSDDGGASFSELMRARGKLFGFAFSPDASELLLGYGDPLEAGGLRVTESGALGIYRAAKGSADFEQRYLGSIGCLTWTGEGLYACTHESDQGYSLGLIRNTDFHLDDAAELEPLLTLKDVVGPLDCASCSAGALCRNYWLATCESWGRSDCEHLEAGECSPAGTGGGPSPPHAATRQRARGGCSCRWSQAVAPAPYTSTPWLGSLFVLGVLARRRSVRGLSEG